MEEKITIKQVLTITHDMLKNIKTIPIEEAEHIGVPISNAIRNLCVCIDAINEDEKRSEAEWGGESNGNVDSE